MALVIDASTPVGHTTTTQTNTCAAFTPPDDPLIVALWAGNTGGSDPGAAPTPSSSPSQAWATDVWDHTLSGSPFALSQAAFFHTVIAGAAGSMTVSVVNGQTVNQWSSILKILVLNGHDPAAPIGVAQGGRQDSGTSITDSYTASIDGGQGFMVISDWAAGATAGWTATSGCTILDKGTLTGEISYATLQRTDPDGVAGASTSMGLTGLPSGGAYHWAIVEVISLEAAVAAAEAAGYPSLGNSPPMF